MKLEVLPLDQKTFSAYGDVIETQEREFFHINNGLVERYHDTAKVEVLEQDRTLISINRAQPAAMPIVVHELERHPLGTQAFVPMNGEALSLLSRSAMINPISPRCGRLLATDGRASIITVMYGITRCLRGRRLPIF